MSFLSPEIYCDNCKQDIIPIKCLYCDKFVNHRCSYSKKYLYYQCMLHNATGIDYHVSIITKEIQWIELFASKRYSIFFSIEDNNMNLMDYNEPILLPKDPLLTPENINNKIKTYLTFL